MLQLFLKVCVCGGGGGGGTYLSNYSPTLLTSVASKILEHITHSHIIKHFEEHSILLNRHAIWL